MSVTMHAQQTWSISHQKKTVLKNVSEDPDNNVITISKALLNTTGCFVITFKAYDTAYTRTVMAYDTVRNGLKNWDDVKKKISIPNAELKSVMAGKNKINIYYTEIPKDPEKAALIRVRLIHICTIILK